MTPRAKKAKRKPTGRPSVYDPKFDRIASRFALLGATDVQLADALGVTVTTLTNWKKAHPSFLSALKSGKEQADAKVVASLYERATGYSHKAVKIFASDKMGVVEVPYIERYPPDATSMIFWLKNRRPAEWRERQEIDHSGKVETGGVLAVPMPVDADQWAAIATRQQAKPSGE